MRRSPLGTSASSPWPTCLSMGWPSGSMPGLPREAVLCAWGITEDGRKVLLHLAPGTKEDTASGTAFFEDLKRRGLPDPLLVVTDGAPGLIRAVETCFPRALRQRCLAHRLRNRRSKAPETQWPE